jgi:hypothetical protein
MKNFLELQDTEFFLDIAVLLSPVGRPEVDLVINRRVIYSGLLDSPMTFLDQIPVMDPFDIDVTLRNKQYGQSQETACTIDQLSIDCFDIVPGWSQLANYINDHDYDQPTNYLGFNGTWSLVVPIPFYQWKHRITGQGMLLNPSTS